MSHFSNELKMEFFVADAERVFSENGKAQPLSHWTYKLVTRSFLESYQRPPVVACNIIPSNFIKGPNYIDFCTWHRFSDFEWLMRQIESEFPGIILPPLPEKEFGGIVDKFTGNFSEAREGDAKNHPLIQQRIRQLQLTLNALSRLVLVHESEVFKAFTTLEDMEWHTYKEERDLETTKPIMASIKNSFMSFISKINSSTRASSEGDSTPPEVVAILEREKQIEQHLRACAKAIEQLVTLMTTKMRRRGDVESTCQPLAGTCVSPLACFQTHMVQLGTDIGRTGVVKRIASDRALVEWDTGSDGASWTPLSELRYPKSGVSDPEVLVLHKFVAQIDSYFAHLCNATELGSLNDVLNMLLFISKFASRCVHAIERLKKMGSNISLPTKGESDCATEAGRIQLMKDNLQSGYSRLLHEYDGFYHPYRSKLLLGVAHSVREVFSNLMIDDWNARLSYAFSLVNRDIELSEDDNEKGIASTNREASPGEHQ
ncbi:hypothetical protein TRVL_00062 [Trypanosoma vivax]|uniref:PX domain-containing protein n=1 Tax=Trypanosoma vivax (strain Y486) TaxID=1055687 RepID=G0TTT6_TRYVY|nr:hypothetical protein TRVL_00062 [Trypanosoma vivax]CCC47368.1 conserved hypothetical protein [Trypanosoma vivax Y486]